MIKKPPIGIPPRFIVNEFRQILTNPFEVMTFDFRRFLDIKGALHRYRNEMYIPPEWIGEYIIISQDLLYHAKYNN